MKLAYRSVSRIDIQPDFATRSKGSRVTLTRYASYRAPLHDGQAVIVPRLAQAAELVQQNQRRLGAWSYDFCGTSVASLRAMARDQLYRDAVRYSQRYRDVDARVRCPSRVIMAGHQPTLFHSGVWFKNFALARISGLQDDRQPSGRCDAVAINLVIDNDVARAASIAVPQLDSASGRITRATVAYDMPSGGVPYEQNWIRDRDLFCSFPDRTQAALARLVDEPLVQPLWRHASEAARRCGNVACAIAQARHALEGDLGLQTLELPLSVACRGEPFAAFALAIFNRAASFRRDYNESLAEYRRVHRIRGWAHPVPDLHAEANYIEVPFWIYGNDAPQRQRAWVRCTFGKIELTDRGGRTITLPVGSGPTALADALSSNFKLRPRALITTMYARLILADLFVHGIGGGKYDQLGDQVMQRFFGLVPPRFMVVSATLTLPTSGAVAPAGPGSREIRQQIRMTRFAPERFADAVPLPTSLCELKRRLLAERPQSGSKKAWHDALADVNRRLATPLEPLRQSLVGQLHEARLDEQAAAILSSREHPFCLFPLQHLTSRYAELLERHA